MAVILIIAIIFAVVTIIITLKFCCGNGTIKKLWESAHEDGVLPTTTNPAYGMTKQGGGRQRSCEYKLGVSAETDPPIADVTYEMPSPPTHQPLPAIPPLSDPPVADVMYEMPSPPTHQPLPAIPPLSDPPIADVMYEMPSPPTHQPLPAIPPLSVAPSTDRGIGVAREREEEDVYDFIPDQ